MRVLGGHLLVLEFVMLAAAQIQKPSQIMLSSLMPTNVFFPLSIKPDV